MCFERLRLCLKPTSGRVPRTGHIIPYGLGAIDSLTQIGPMARFVEDLTLALPIIAGPDGRDPAIIPMRIGDPAGVELRSLRVAVHISNGIMDPTPKTADVVKAAAKALSDAGIAVEEDRPEALAMVPDLNIIGADARAWTRRLLRKYGTTEVHPWLQRKFYEQEAVSVADFTALLEKLDSYRSSMLSFMERYDAILCPVTAMPAPAHGGTFEGGIMGKAFAYVGAYNLTGWPGAVVRGGTSSEGLPIGVQVVARPWREDVALALARHIETALGGWQRPPL